MHGAGTKTAITTNSSRARCLDVTRLISRVGRGPFTGVDRVELAYLTHFTKHPDPFFALVRSTLGYMLLDKSGAQQILDRLIQQLDWGPIDMIGRFFRKAHPMKRRAEADLRRLAIARCRKSQLAAMLHNNLPADCTYINVGHSNLSDHTLLAWARQETAKIVVLVHDTIPLDFPQFQRDGTVATFEARLRRVSQYADHVICISAETQRRVQHWFQKWKASVPTSVAHLGVDAPPISQDDVPQSLQLAQNYFVCVGTIEPRKNHALLLDIWDDLSQRQDAPILVIAGARGWKNEEIFSRLDKHPPNIIEAPNLSDGAIGALMAGSTGLLFPTFAEGFGLPPAEALALDVPAICSDLPVLREILGNKAIYAESDDMYLWKQSIERLMEEHKAGQAKTSEKNTSFDAPTWENHFNLVLKVA